MDFDHFAQGNMIIGNKGLKVSQRGGQRRVVECVDVNLIGPLPNVLVLYFMIVHRGHNPLQKDL